MHYKPDPLNIIRVF